MGIMGIMGSMGKIHKSKNGPAQRDSGISNLVVGLTSRTSLTSPTEPQCSSAQRDSGISKLGLSRSGGKVAVQQIFYQFRALASESIPYIVNHRHIEDAGIKSLLIIGKEKLTCEK